MFRNIEHFIFWRKECELQNCKKMEKDLTFYIKLFTLFQGSKAMTSFLVDAYKVECRPRHNL